MAITLTVTEAYCTLDEADAYNENSATWVAATDEVKTEALIDARYYIDGKFDCDLDEYTTVPDELKYANSVLADDIVSDPTVIQNKQSLKLKRVKAGSVESEIEYFGGGFSTPPSLSKVKSILQDLCSSLSGSLTRV